MKYAEVFARCPWNWYLRSCSHHYSSHSKTGASLVMVSCGAFFFSSSSTTMLLKASVGILICCIFMSHKVYHHLLGQKVKESITQQPFLPKCFPSIIFDTFCKVPVYLSFWIIQIPVQGVTTWVVCQCFLCLSFTEKGKWVILQDVLFVTLLSIDRTSKPELTELSTPVIPDYIAWVYLVFT